MAWFADYQVGQRIADRLVVRPDQYVGHVLPLDVFAELTGCFGRLLRVRRPG